MDIKKAHFSPSIIDEVENSTIERLVGNVNIYAAPVEYRGRPQSTWDLLASAYPPPGDSTIQSYVQQWGLQRRFSPSTINEVDNTTVERLVGAVGRYVAPVEYRG